MFWGESFKSLTSSSCNGPAYILFRRSGWSGTRCRGLFVCAYFQGSRSEETVISIPQHKHFMFVWYIICAMYE